MKTVIRIGGMTCAHCLTRVESALKEVEGVETVKVDLESGRGALESEKPLDDSKIKKAIEEVGYKYLGQTSF
jgi:copper chaperone CopZ